jgi:hypothetical protein
VERGRVARNRDHAPGAVLFSTGKSVLSARRNASARWPRCSRTSPNARSSWRATPIDRQGRDERQARNSEPTR